MGVMRECSNCGHRQMVGHNAVDGRLKWWTRCDNCKRGNFMAKPDISNSAHLPDRKNS